MPLAVDRRKGDRHKPRKGDRHKVRSGRRSKEYYQKYRAERKFVGVDGEGWGKTYALLADSGGFHVDDVNGLSTVQCFDFLSQLKERNGRAIFVGFALSYDINHWLKDMPSAALYALYKNGKVRWEDWWMEWAPKRWFHILHLPSCKHPKWKRGEDGKLLHDKDGHLIPHGHLAACKSVRIWDAFPFFQGSFLKACKDWEVDVPEEVRKGKAARHDFTEADLPTIIAYNRVELDTLARLMDKLRAGMTEAGVPVDQWYGAGAAASKLLQINRISETIYDTPPEMERAVLGGYFGGHIEAARFGSYRGPVLNYDLNSAYASALSGIPNLKRGKWVRKDSYVEGYFLALYHVEWNWPRGSPYYPLPWRDKDGSIYFPRVGRCWVWAPEVIACKERGWPLEILEGWMWLPKNGVHGLRYPFRFVKKQYAARLNVGKKSGAGLAIKVALSAIYGKTAQREGHYGRPTYRQFEVAGHVTSWVRALLWILADREEHSSLEGVISFNTDGLYLAGTGDESATERLGDLSATTYRGIDIAEAGVYRLLHADGCTCGKCVERQDGRWENYGRGFGKEGVPWERWRAARENGEKEIVVEIEHLFTLGECLHGGWVRTKNGRKWVKPWVDRKKWRSWADGKSQPMFKKTLHVSVPSKKRIGPDPFDPMFGVPAESAPHDPRRQDVDLTQPEESDET